MKTLKNKIDESLIKSYDTNKLINKIKTKYKEKINDIHIQKSKSYIQSFSIQFNEKYNDEIVYDELLYKLIDFFGYYITEYKYIISEKNYILRFEPIFGTKCNDLVYKKCDGIIYHITQENFIKNIRKKGLIPFENNSYRNFTNRLFFCCGESKEEIKNNIKFLLNQISNKDSYIILKINLLKYNYKVDFYYDPSEDDKHNYIYANAYFFPHMIEEIGTLNDFDNIKENKKVMLNNKKIILQEI